MVTELIKRLAESGHQVRQKRGLQDAEALRLSFRFERRTALTRQAPVLPRAGYESVKLGQPVDVITEQPAGGRYKAIVKVIDKVFDAASGTFGVRLELANPGAKIPAGDKCKAVFDGVAETVRRRANSQLGEALK